MAGEKQRLFASRALLDEFANVLGRQKLAKSVSATGDGAADVGQLPQSHHLGDGTAVAAVGVT